MNFPKGQRAIAFDRATAFPLDANAYFESLVSAEAAVKSAEEVGSKLASPILKKLKFYLTSNRKDI